MNFKNLCAIVLLFAFGINNLLAQNEELSGAMLLISYQKNDNSKERGQINLSGHEAYEFDIVDFLNKNKFKDVQINGGAVLDDQRLTWHFNSKKLDQPIECNRFCEVITSVDKSPFLGVGVVALDDFSGVRVTKIIEESAAEKYGFQIGDIITLINEYEIYTPCDITKTISKFNPGDVLDVDIIRDEVNETKEPVLGYRLHKRLSWKPCCDQPSVVLENSSTTNDWNANLSVFPNPTDGISQVKYTASEKGNIQLNITDLTGRIIFTKDIKEFDGFYNDAIDLTNQSSGIYFLNIIQDEKVRTERIVLQKP